MWCYFPKSSVLGNMLPGRETVGKLYILSYMAKIKPNLISFSQENNKIEYSEFSFIAMLFRSLLGTQLMTDTDRPSNRQKKLNDLSAVLC